MDFWFFARVRSFGRDMLRTIFIDERFPEASGVPLFLSGKIDCSVDYVLR